MRFFVAIMAGGKFLSSAHEKAISKECTAVNSQISKTIINQASLSGKEKKREKRKKN